MSAFWICPLAPSTFDLSPPDIIHLIPPKIKENKKDKEAIIKAIIKSAEIIPPIETLPKPKNCPEGLICISTLLV